MQITKSIEGKDKLFFGTRKEDGSTIYITKPSFDCGRYWSFGYLGNSSEHYHLSSYQKKQHYLKLADGTYKLLTEKRNINMFDALLFDYDLSAKIKANLWSFCEQAETIYNLKKVAEIAHIGGSHYTTHPLKNLLKGFDGGQIKSVLLPQLLQRFWDDFSE